MMFYHLLKFVFPGLYYKCNLQLSFAVRKNKSSLFLENGNFWVSGKMVKSEMKREGGWWNLAKKLLNLLDIHILYKFSIKELDFSVVNHYTIIVS